MTFKINGKEWDNAYFMPTEYTNGNRALVVNDDDGRLYTCSVNPGKEIPNDCIAIKDYSENVGMVNALSEMGIIGEWVEDIPSGWVVIPVFRLTEKGLALYNNPIEKDSY